MNRDPLYRNIIKGLEGPLDPELFEDCAAVLLRTIYPGLVPIRGGSDAGMDGAIADGLGQPFALITTTEKDVIGNLSKNLAARIADHDPRRKAVLATSRALTPRRRRNLHERAEELGFELVQIHDQAAMADLLYHSPELCLELLGLMGEPPALSVKPWSSRPLLNQGLVGRESDLAWLCNTTGDHLLVGQPGSGKSFLLHQVALKGRGLFVNSVDLAKIAGGIRAQEPSALLVDDTQVSPKLLVDLKHLREDIGAAFDIVASCWPGDNTPVASALGVSSFTTRVLEPLTRDELVEVVKGVGVYGPTDLIREIVNQAEGRPGLAATLAHLCLQGATRDVLLGDALNTSLLSPFESKVGPQTKEVLACFAVGGNSGMAMATVAEYLGLPLSELRRVVANLASGGIIIEPSEGHLAVRPAALRHILLRDVFFAQFALPIMPLLRQVPRMEDTVHDLLAARARGGGVRDEFLLELLEGLDSPECWNHYAWLGKTEAKWVLRHHPEHLIVVARTLLRRAPEDTIQSLLKAAIGDERPLHATPDHPLRLLGDWISGGDPGTEEALVRRRILWAETQRWLLAGADSHVGLKTLHFALRPDFEDHEVDPGSGNQVTLRFGYISHDNMMALKTLIPEVIETIRAVGVIEWHPLRELIEDWAHPKPTNGPMTAETRNVMRAVAADLLQAFIPVAEGHPGILRWAYGLAGPLELEIEILVDQDFEVLFPVMEARNWKDAQILQTARARELAWSWAGRAPLDAAADISRIEREAALADARWPRLSPFVCAVIAEKTNDPISWAEALRAVSAPVDLIGPFLHRAAALGQSGWITLTSSCLDETEARGVAVELVLSLPSPPVDLLQLTLGTLTGHSSLVGSLCLRRQVPDDTLKALLNHAEQEVASAAAYGEWSAEPEGTVKNLLHDDWRRAVVRSLAPEHWLIQVLSTDPSLAKEWLRARLAEDLQDYYHYKDAIVTAIGALDLNSKRELIQMLTPGIAEQQLVGHLVGDDIRLYSELLQNRHLADLHLVPLGGHPNSPWFAKAKAALNAGYGPEEIAHALIWFRLEGVEWEGKRSSVWGRWIEEFKQLTLDADEDVRRIAVAGLVYASSQYQDALARELHKAVYGYE